MPHIGVINCLLLVHKRHKRTIMVLISGKLPVSSRHAVRSNGVQGRFYVPLGSISKRLLSFYSFVLCPLITVFHVPVFRWVILSAPALALRGAGDPILLTVVGNSSQ